MVSIRAISGGRTYRFYLEMEGPGEWVGTGAKLLGLPAAVNAEEFGRLRCGLHSETGEPLRPIRNVDRAYVKVDKDGAPFKQIYRARNLYDLTVSAPKSVSIQNVIDPRMAGAHALAVEHLRLEMERLCGPMIMAAYQHSYSRKLDSQVHTHLVAPNLAYRIESHDWGRLDANILYLKQPELTNHYGMRLGQMLTAWGYEMDGRELAHISPELRERFSRRGDDIEMAIRAHMKQHGMTERPSRKETDIIVRDYRQKKDYALSPDELRAYQLARLTPAERDNLIRVRDEALERSEKLKLKVHDEPHFEPGLKRQQWDYGEGYRGPRMRL